LVAALVQSESISTEDLAEIRRILDREDVK